MEYLSFPYVPGNQVFNLLQQRVHTVFLTTDGLLEAFLVSLDASVQIQFDQDLHSMIL